MKWKDEEKRGQSGKAKEGGRKIIVTGEMSLFTSLIIFTLVSITR